MAGNRLLCAPLVHILFPHLTTLGAYVALEFGSELVEFLMRYYVMLDTHLISHHNERESICLHICIVDKLIAPQSQSSKAIAIIYRIAQQADVRAPIERCT